MRWATLPLGLALLAPACGFETPQFSSGDAMLPVTVGFLSATSLQDETSGDVTVPVALSAPAGDTVTVQYAFSGGSATSGEDYTGTAGTLTFAPGETQKRIPLMILPDAVEESDETIELTLMQVTGGVLGASRHAVTISANVLPRVQFALSASSDMENVSPTLTLNVLGANPLGGSITFAIDSGVVNSAANGSDYTLNNLTVTIPPNVTSVQVPIPVNDDASDEYDEHVVLTLTESTNIVVAATNQTHDHTILDNDAEPTVFFPNPTVTRTEAGETLSIEVQLSVASGKPVTVEFAATQTTTLGLLSDYLYLAIPQRVSFDPGQATKQILVTLLSDNIDEDDEVLITELANPVNATLGAASQQNLTITDNDTSAVRFGNPNNISANENDNTDVTYTYNLTLSTPSSKTVTAPVTVTGTATSGDDFDIMAGDLPVVFNPGDTTKPIRVIVRADKSREQNETVILTVDGGGIVNAVAGSPNQRTHTIRNDD